jgi:hypothetical protein
VDKHPQPSHDSDGLPGLLSTYYGNLTADATRFINAGHETGDLHIAIYDFAGKGLAGKAKAEEVAGTPKMWVSVGRVDGDGNYGSDNREWKACFRPYLEFTMADLWAGAW